MLPSCRGGLEQGGAVMDTVNVNTLANVVTAICAVLITLKVY
jgi:hypothetical protein